MKKITQNFYQVRTQNKANIWLSFFVLLLSVCNVGAITRTSAASGAWNVAGTWSPSGVPATGDDVIIAVGHVITAPTSNVNVNTLTVYGSFLDSGTIKINTASDFVIGDGINPASVTIGTANNGGIFISGTGNLTINALASLTMSSNFVVPGTTTISGTVNLNAIGSSRASTFTGDFILNPGAVWNDTSGTGSLRTDTFSGNFVNNATTYTIPFNGFKVFAGAGKTISGATAINATGLNVTGTVTLESDSVLNVSAALGGAGTLTNLGVLNIGGSSTVGLNAGGFGNTVNYTGASQTVKAVLYYNLGLSGSGVKTITTGTTIAGNLTISGTAQANITTGGAVPGGTLTLGTTTVPDGASYGGPSSEATNIDATYFAPTTAGNYINVSVLGTDDFNVESGSSIYSNGNQVFVSNVKSNTIVTVYSVSGALVKTVETSSDTSFDLGAGVYVAKVKSAEGEKSVKLLVK